METTDIKSKTINTLSEMMELRGYSYSDKNSKNHIHEYMDATKEKDCWFEYNSNNDNGIISGRFNIMGNRQTQVLSFKQQINEKIEELKETHNHNNITIIYIMSDKPNDNIPKACYEIYLNTGIYVQVFSLNRLAFNVTKHKMVPTHEILNEKDKDEFMELHGLNEDTILSIPQILYTDPVVMFIGAKPGDICKITRQSKSSVTTTTFRYVV